MSLSQSPLIKPTGSSSALTHIHTGVETCPTCDQPIPHDRFDEIKDRIETRQAAREAQITARLLEEFGREKAEAVERTRQEGVAATTAQVASAREEERQKAEVSLSQKLAEAERLNKEVLVTMQSRIEEAQTAQTSAEQANTALQEQLNHVRRDSEAAIQKVKQEAETNAMVIRHEAQTQAEAAVHHKLTELERTRQESEATYQARIKEAEATNAIVKQSNADLVAKINQMRFENETAVAKVRHEAEEQLVTARQEIIASVESSMRENIASAEQARTEAESKLLASEQQLSVLKNNYEADVAERLKEQREAMERAQTEAVNVERQAAFEKELKLSNKVEELQRTLADKTAEELGEGAELDLYEVLKGQFEGDRIERINKGQPGADILHVVIHNGKECGSIIYDSKNHNAWRNEFVTKLASDQMAAKADHAILSTRRFPAKQRHLHVQDGVILATPARVAALVQIVRQHIVATHILRLSDEARTQKTAELYAFINSERCRDLFKRIDSQADKLLDVQVKEKKAHEAIWKTQGELIRSIQKVQAEICNEIDSIVGTADTV